MIPQRTHERDDAMPMATAADGTTVRAHDEGEGPVVLMLHPGMETGTRYKKVAQILSKRFRVIRLHRRQYRLDLKKDSKVGSTCTAAQEVEHVLAVVRAVGAPVLLYGHSSGGTIALEALVTSPASFMGGVIYEPALVTGAPGSLHLTGDAIPSNGELGEGVRQAREALAAGKPGKAMGIFIRISAGLPEWISNLAGELTALFPVYRSLIACQIDDLEVMERLGSRLDVYSKIPVPVALVGGERSPAHVKEIFTTVAGALPSAERVVLHGQGHNGHVRDPQQLSRIIETFVRKVDSS
jgi:pimeloyl-ACP methyl ester carboxylesterase